MVSRQDDSRLSEDGRANQKLRTRRAIVEAAAAFVRENRTPTVAEAAERALVSRATAYRYFPSQQSLLVEVQADAAQPSPQQVLAQSGDDPVERVETIARAITRMVLADEALFRNQVRTIQDLWFSRDGDTETPVREGRRLVWIDEALKPLRGKAPKMKLTRLRHALTATIGVEPVLCLRDVAGLDDKAIEDTLAWVSTTIVSQLLSGR